MSSIQEWKVEEPWLESNCALAEGPFYEKETDSFRFVDIKKKQILYAHGVSSPDAKQSFPMSSVEVIQLDVAPGVTADIEGVDPREKILLGMKYGLSILDRKTGQYKMLAPFNEQLNERIRANDGAADPHGRFLLGSMTDFGQGHFRPEGSLFRFTKDTSKETILSPVTIPNGIGWSPDLRIMYFTHSPTREVFKYDYDVETGNLSNQRHFYRHPTTGEPDGLRVDVEGNVWQAFYGEHMVLKINPEGQVVGKVNLPARNITCVQFVDEDLFITTAAEEEGQVSDQVTKYGGSIFRVHVGIKGVDLFKFKL